NRIHIRRARLLGLDAPQKLDIRGLYRIGGDQQSAERLARERVLEAVPLDEQERMYEVLAAEYVLSYGSEQAGGAEDPAGRIVDLRAGKIAAERRYRYYVSH